MKALVEDGVLKNPPAVLLLDDRVGEYVVIDGANRTQALLSPGLSYAPMQFLHPVGDEITLDTWAQVIEGCSPDDLAREVEQTAGLRKSSWTEECEIEDSPPGKSAGNAIALEHYPVGCGG